MDTQRPRQRLKYRQRKTKHKYNQDTLACCSFSLKCIIIYGLLDLDGRLAGWLVIINQIVIQVVQNGGKLTETEVVVGGSSRVVV